jgi:hypothetical protein
MWVCTKTVNDMDMAYYFIQMEEFMKELGVKIGCMVKEK